MYLCMHAAGSSLQPQRKVPAQRAAAECKVRAPYQVWCMHACGTAECLCIPASRLPPGRAAQGSGGLAKAAGCRMQPARGSLPEQPPRPEGTFRTSLEMQISQMHQVVHGLVGGRAAAL